MSTMQLLRHGPIGLGGLFRDFDQLLDDGPSTFHPSAAIHELGDKFRLYLDAPGVRPDDFNIELDKDVLTIQGERFVKESEEKGRWSFNEQAYGKFMRQFRLPESVDGERINASYDHGVLVLDIPKMQKAAPTKISISATEGGEKKSLSKEKTVKVEHDAH